MFKTMFKTTLVAFVILSHLGGVAHASLMKSVLEGSTDAPKHCMNMEAGAVDTSDETLEDLHTYLHTPQHEAQSTHIAHDQTDRCACEFHCVSKALIISGTFADSSVDALQQSEFANKSFNSLKLFIDLPPPK